MDEAKIGIEVVKREEDQMVTRDEIQKSVWTLMDDDQYSGDHERVKSLKENCKKLKELAKKAVSEDGSSSKNFNMVVVRRKTEFQITTASAIAKRMIRPCTWLD